MFLSKFVLLSLAATVALFHHGTAANEDVVQQYLRREEVRDMAAEVSSFSFASWVNVKRGIQPPPPPLLYLSTASSSVLPMVMS